MDRAADFESACGGSTPPGAIATLLVTRKPAFLRGQASPEAPRNAPVRIYRRIHRFEPAGWSLGFAGVTMQVVTESYYTARSRRDPAWRLRAIAAAAERYRAAKNADPERVLGYSRAYRSRLRETSLTMAQLRQRARIAHGLVLRRRLLFIAVVASASSRSSSRSGNRVASPRSCDHGLLPRDEMCPPILNPATPARRRSAASFGRRSQPAASTSSSAATA